ncbi:amidohydrolase family protein [Longimicrobium sp.]|uniref:amidohydrolase family protein n=1 Tax=Longimicrobium sp. TaxID=2029185 RepID=UPI002E3174E4|nr:amidohydrolase family protein [Longimicrobium sp.]HEX6039877.1 amidohydrolase family protein [Longimicrobium sp.]
MIRRTFFLTAATLLAAGASPSTAPAQQAASAQMAPAGTRTEVIERGAMDPALSPDGRWIAMSVLGKLFLLPVGGGDAVQLTTGAGWDERPAWSPNGQFIAYAHQTPSTDAIMEMNLATGVSTLVREVEGGLGHIEYHPSSSELFYVLTRGQYDAHLWRLPRTGGESRQLTQTQNWHEWSFALSPRADSVFLESGRYGGADLYVMALDSLRPARLTETPARNEFSVAWSRDGRTRMWIVGQNGVDTVMAQTGAAAPRAVHVSPYGQKQLTVDGAGRFAVLADGRRLYRIDLAGGTAAPIPFRAPLALPARADGDLAITNARVWTGTDGDRVMENATVEVRGGRIVRVHRGTPEAGLPVLDAAGKTLLPGLVDNHAHYWFPFQGERLVARGITSVRDPGAAISSSMSFKDANRLGVVLGPTIYSAGPLIDAPGGYHPMVDVAIEDPAYAAALVRALKEQGVDLLKLYFLLDPQVARAVLAEAERQGLPVTGHIGVRTSLREAIDAGIEGFSHIRVWRDVLPLDAQPQGEDETLDRDRAPLARMQADWWAIDPEGAEMGDLLRLMAARGVALDPTLTVQRVGERDRARFSLEDFATASESYRRMSRFVRRAHEMGVMLLAGTDGGSLNEEMEAYAAAGIPNADILRSATVNAARWLGREGEFGTIQPGLRADFLLVDGDPLRDIRDARKVSAVIKEGRIVVRN